MPSSISYEFYNLNHLYRGEFATTTDLNVAYPQNTGKRGYYAYVISDTSMYLYATYDGKWYKQNLWLSGYNALNTNIRNELNFYIINKG